MLEVKDGNRTLYVDGVQIGTSTSYRRGSTRWIEFQLYKTVSGQYVLSRVGVSLVYHGAACELVTNYNLNDLPFKDLRSGSIPCERCKPTEAADLVFPERDRFWAQVSDNPGAVLEALYKYDEFGAKYLTSVAKRLLESAGRVDKDIQSVYTFETIR